MVQIGLTPSEALRACNSPCTKQKLSYELNVCAAIVHRGIPGSSVMVDIDDEASLVESSVTTSSHDSSSGKTNNSWWNKCIKKHRNCTKVDLTSGGAASIASFGEKCAHVSIDLSSSSSTEKSSKNNKRSIIRVSPSFASKKRSIDQQGRALENEQYNKAMAEAVSLVKELEIAKLSGQKVVGCKTYQAICNLVNGKYLTSFSRSITRTSLNRYYTDGVTSAKSRGPRPKISDTLVKAVSLHASMMQVSGTGEAKPRQLKGLINATTRGTVHEGTFSHDYLYTKVLSSNASTMEASSGRTQEDIRGQWTTYEKMHLWFETTKQDLLKLGLAVDKPVFNADKVMIEEVFIPEDCKCRMINFDETDHPLSSEDDRGGPRARTYTNPSLPRPGGSSTRGSRHTTGVYGTTAGGETLPPLFIFDSAAQTEEGLRVNEKSVIGLPRISGLFGCPTVQEFPSFVAVRASGSMDEKLFQEYVQNVILPLYPNISPEVVRDDGGRLLSGPVWVNCDSGPGRLAASYSNIEWRTQMKDVGLHLGLGCPNGTSVGQVMDDLFQTFKGACRTSTQELFNQKVYERMLKIRRRNQEEGNNLTTKIAAVVSLHQEDIPKIVNGSPGDPIDQRPFNKCFTPSRIKKCWSNIGLSPFTMNALTNKKIRHELGQSSIKTDRYIIAVQTPPQEVAEANSSINALNEEYQAIKAKLKDEGFNHEIFDVDIPHAYKAERKDTEEEQVEQLVKKGATFSASGIFMNTGSMLITSDALLSASKQVLDNRNKKQQAQNDKALEKVQVAKTKALVAYDTFKKGNKDTGAMYNDMLKYLLVATESSDKMSSFKSKVDTKNRLIQTDNWEDIFIKLKAENVTENVIVDQPPESIEIADQTQDFTAYDEHTI